MRRIIIGISIIFFAAIALAQDYTLERSVLGGGGGKLANEEMIVQFTLGQNLIAVEATNDLSIQWGYWYWPGSYTGVEDETPKFIFKLHQNYPNPFNPVTRIPYTVGGEKPTYVSLVIYDVRGSVVCRLVDQVQSPGQYTALWDGSSETGRKAASGIYFCRIQTNTFEATKKLVLLR